MPSGAFRLFVALGAVGLFAGMVSPALPAPAQGLKCASDPLVGTWRLDKKKSTITRNNGVIDDRIAVIAPFGDDGITYVFINDGDPRLSGREETWSVQFDGKAWPTRGGDPRLMKWTRVDCNTFEFDTLRQLVFNLPEGTVKAYYPEGQVQSHGRIVVAPDGKTFADTHSGQLGNQTKYNDEVLVFDRL
jgi:hypothetical protein